MLLTLAFALLLYGSLEATFVDSYRERNVAQQRPAARLAVVPAPAPSEVPAEDIEPRRLEAVSQT
jgi:hypothetical protein